MAQKKEENALIVPGDTYFPVLAMPVNAKEILEQNLGIATLEIRDLPTVRVPSGGQTVWQVQTAEGIKSMDELLGIIVHNQTTRQYWTTSYDENPNQPPDCSSADGLIGVGTPGGDCLTCPMNKFGSGKKKPNSKSNPKACQEKRVIFTVLANHALPHGVVAPTMSLKTTKQYLVNLAAAMIPSYARVTSFKLEGDKNADGLKYSKIIPMAYEVIEGQQLEYMKKYVEGIKPFLEKAVKEMAQSAMFRDEAMEAEFSSETDEA